MNGMLVSPQDSYIGTLIPTVDAESLVKLMPKTEPLCTSTKLNLRDRVLGKVEKNSFIALPGKGDHSRLLPWITMNSHPGWFDGEFYSKGGVADSGVCRASVQFSCSVLSKSFRTHGLQHAVLPVHHQLLELVQTPPTSSSSVAPFSSYLKSFPASESFLRSQFLTSGGQSIGASASVLPMNIPVLISFRISWFDLPAGQGALKSLLQHHSLKASILQHSALFMVQLSHPYMITGKTIALTRWTFVGKVIPLLFNMLSRLVITFLPRSKRLLISWLQSPSAVIVEHKKIKFVLNQLFHSPLSLSSRGSLVPLRFLPLEWYHCISEVVDISPGSFDSSLCFIQPGISHDVLWI